MGRSEVVGLVTVDTGILMILRDGEAVGAVFQVQVTSVKSTFVHFKASITDCCLAEIIMWLVLLV